MATYSRLKYIDFTGEYDRGAEVKDKDVKVTDSVPDPVGVPEMCLGTIYLGEGKGGVFIHQFCSLYVKGLPRRTLIIICPTSSLLMCKCQADSPTCHPPCQAGSGNLSPGAIRLHLWLDSTQNES